ncbi:hypothetical protein UY3_10962 [Chelonia mydas]|uniref:Uncharacterized protein n=1 Tax=Chelonia mydas TaxID=8469 RepID=M7B4A0_CHEMY|nr:hypothetical protein UY3_10962 [Chelonia mydas]
MDTLLAAERGGNPQAEILDQEVKLEEDVVLPAGLPDGAGSQELFSTTEVLNREQEADMILDVCDYSESNGLDIGPPYSVCSSNTKQTESRLNWSVALSSSAVDLQEKTPAARKGSGRGKAAGKGSGGSLLLQPFTAAGKGSRSLNLHERYADTMWQGQVSLTGPRTTVALPRNLRKRIAQVLDETFDEITEADYHDVREHINALFRI